MQCNAMQCNAMQCNVCMHACMYVCIFSFSQHYVCNTRRTYIYIYIYEHHHIANSYNKALDRTTPRHLLSNQMQSAGWGYHPRMRMAGRDLRFATATRAGDMDGRAVMRSKTLSRAGEGDFLQRSQTGFVSAVRLESQEQTNLCASDCRLTLFILGLLLAPGTRRIAATNPYTAAKRCGNTCTLNGALWHHRRDKQHFCPLGILKQRKANQFSS